MNEPMSLRELIARLNAKTANMEPTISAPGRRPSQVENDLRGALGRVTAHPAGTRTGQLIVMASWMGDESVTAEIATRLSDWFRIYAKRRRAKIKKPEYLEGVARLAVIECTSPKNCQGCAGRQTVAKGKLRVVCRLCGGTGMGRRSDRERARIAGVPYKTWRTTWRSRFELLKNLLDDQESLAIRIMRTELGHAPQFRVRRPMPADLAVAL